MTEMQSAGIPEWDVHDRLGKALRHANVKSADMAEYLGVHRNTISAYLNGRTGVDLRTMRLWALRTGVAFEWLAEGTGPSAPPPGGGLDDAGSSSGSALARLTASKASRSAGGGHNRQYETAA